MSRLFLGCLFLVWSVFFMGACSEPPVVQAAAELWPSVEMDLPEATFFNKHKWLLDVSSWAAKGCGQNEPTDARHMGDFPVGNGHVFALMGYTCPINTLHNMAGPDYQQEANFFHDTSLQVFTNAKESAEAVTSGSVFRVRRTAIIITREVMDSVELITVTFAPLCRRDDDPVNKALIRIALVKNFSDSTVKGLVLKAQDATRTRNGRRRVLALMQAEVADPAEVALGDMAPGQQQLVWYAYVTTVVGDDGQDVISALKAEGIDSLLESTRDGWFSYMDEHSQLDCPDPRVEDLFDSVLVTIKTQQAFLGGVSPMSRYSLMWIRDTAGVVRFLLRVGLFEQARQMLDYYHMAAAMRGDITNSVPLDLEPDTPPAEPDWASMPAFGGRTQAESPSYLPLVAHWYTLGSGDNSLVDSQYEMLTRALDGQVISDDGLQGFGGDETYRPAMSVAFGRDIGYDWVSCCKSANSSFLFVAASEAMASEARSRADDARVHRLLERSDRVGKAAEETFWSEDGFYLPFVDELEPVENDMPFEDVSTKPLWTGYSSPDDERALQNLKRVVELIGRPDGFLQSWADPSFADFMGLKIHKGIFTGMVPGYYLANLAMVDHPEAQNAFNSLSLAASPSGNFSEDHIYDDYSILQLLYDASGTISDMSARCRPWEGAVNLDALVFYLTGLVQNAPERSVHLAPRLPNHWPSMTWKNLRVGSSKFDMKVEDSGSMREVSLELTEGDPIQVFLDLPIGAATIESIEVSGEVIDKKDWDTWSPFGETRLRLDSMALKGTSTLLVRVEYHLNCGSNNVVYKRKYLRPGIR